MTKEIEVDGKLVTLQIWDTAGQERYFVFEVLHNFANPGEVRTTNKTNSIDI